MVTKAKENIFAKNVKAVMPKTTDSHKDAIIGVANLASEAYIRGVSIDVTSEAVGKIMEKVTIANRTTNENENVSAEN